jgi:5-methylcytosine-specific restriction endonuclease McrBC GTP-binding regulatory subunit McrB
MVTSPMEEYIPMEDEYKELQKNGLRIPQNVLVIGTVNMDDTTHQFSRKVIDRAMTIEMNEVKFDTFFDSNNELGYTDEPLGKEYFFPKYTTAGKALESIPEDAEIIKKDVPILLEQLNEALDGTPFKIAYRVQNELVLYFASLRQEDEYQGWKTEELLNKAMDGILMMKVLPRIEGDKDLLEECLINLAEFAKNYPSASMKISEMQSRLKKSQFTSFWP